MKIPILDIEYLWRLSKKSHSQFTLIEDYQYRERKPFYAIVRSVHQRSQPCPTRVLPLPSIRGLMGQSQRSLKACPDVASSCEDTSADSPYHSLSFCSHRVSPNFLCIAVAMREPTAIQASDRTCGTCIRFECSSPFQAFHCCECPPQNPAMRLPICKNAPIIPLVVPPATSERATATATPQFMYPGPSGNGTVH
jgi:hypothetical protein